MVYAKKRLQIISLILCLFVMIAPIHVSAQEQISNHQYLVLDHAEKLSKEEKQGLISAMKEYIPDGNCLVITFDTEDGNKNESDTIANAKRLYRENCGNTDGAAVVIDLSTRYIEVLTFEKFVDYIPNYKAATIADEVYDLARHQLYNECFINAIKRIGRYLPSAKSKGPIVKDANIPASMQIVTNILLALVIALILNFYFLKFLSRTPEANANALAQSADVNVDVNPGNHLHVRTEKNDYDLGSIEGILLTRNWFGKFIHLVFFILIVAVRILAIGGGGGRSGGGGGGRSGGGGGRSGGGGHRF